MATIRRVHYGGQGYSESIIKAFFDSLNCPLIEVSIESNAVVLNVDNVVDVLFNFYAGRTQVRYNGVTNSYSIINRYNSLGLTALFNENIFYVQWNCEYGAGRRFCFLYEKIEGISYFGAVGAGTDTGSGHAWYSIVDIPLTNVNNSITYAHGIILNYSVEQGYIHYTSDYLFSSGYKTPDVDTNFITCSPVPTDRVITFKSHNYYSIGANTLIGID